MNVRKNYCREGVKMKKLECVFPTIRTYLGDAFCHSIIDKYAVGSGWNYDKYINIQYIPDDRMLKYADYDYYDFVDGEGVFIKSFIEFSSRQASQIKVCSIIEEMIDNSEYIFALWDENIVAKDVLDICRVNKFIHGCFIYGYDSKRKIFLSQGYLTGREFIQFEVKYDTFYRAICSAHENRNMAIIGYTLMDDYDWKFSFDRMFSDFENYFQPCNDNNKLLNVQAERAFFDDIIIYERIHMPSVFCIYEHNKIMDDRVKFLISNHFIMNNQKIIYSLDSIRAISKKILLLSIKYNFCVKKSLISEIVSHGEDLITKESELINLVINNSL